MLVKLRSEMPSSLCSRRQESDSAIRHAPIGADGSGPFSGSFGPAFHAQIAVVVCSRVLAIPALSPHMEH